MRNQPFIFGVMFVAGVALTGNAAAWETDEHALLAGRAYKAVLDSTGFEKADGKYTLDGPAGTTELPERLWEEKTFAELCAWLAKDDNGRARYHVRDFTILDQLRPLKASHLEALWQQHSAGEIQSAEDGRFGVVANYFIHHYVAVRWAESAGPDDGGGDALRSALVYEAMAQGYLADAFSAGHMRLPGGLFRGVFRRNYQAAHDEFGVAGLYVIDSRGNVWQTFGDQLLFWYAPTHRYATEACETSLREVLLAYFVGAGAGKIPRGLEEWVGAALGDDSPECAVREWTAPDDGEVFYSVKRVPTLLMLPVPVSASWSMRTATVDEYGIHVRHHFPQLSDTGYHDPSLEDVHLDMLYAKSSVPAWSIPDRLEALGPEAFIRTDAEAASVRYTQKTSVKPSYKGVVASLGAGPVFDGSGSEPGYSLGLGYGFTDGSPVFKRSSLDLILNPRFGADERTLLSVSAHGSIGLPNQVVDAALIEAGYSWGLKSPFKDHGSRLGLGLESTALPLGFVYTGILLRVKYEWYFFDPTLRAVVFDLVLH